MLETTIAGSLPRPAWLAQPEALKGDWKLSGEELEEGKRRAATEWIRHQEEAGIAVLTDGEVFRKHFVHTFLEGIEGITIQKQEDNYLYAECKTKFMGYVDDLEFYWREADGVCHVRSASRLGYGDMGVNRKRVETIRTRFQELSATAPAAQPA